VICGNPAPLPNPSHALERLGDGLLTSFVGRFLANDGETFGDTPSAFLAGAEVKQLCARRWADKFIFWRHCGA
jgi:hypothetical protein